MKLRTLALLALTVTTLALGGCSSGAEPDGAPRQDEPTTALPTEPTQSAEPTVTPSPDAVHTRISRQVRNAHFPRTDGDYHNWLSDVADTGRRAVVARRVLPCDDAKVALAIDRRVLAHTETVVEQGDYLVSRQLTLYPDAATADTFVSQLSENRIGCTTLMGSSDLGAVQRLGYAPDRFFGTQDKFVTFSETTMSYGDNRYVFIDVINQLDNAIVFTRVGLNGTVNGRGVSRAKEENPGFVREVRAQGDRGTAILRQLSAD